MARQWVERQVVPAHEVRCNGCGGVGGRHTELACPFFVDRAQSTIRRKERRK